MVYESLPASEEGFRREDPIDIPVDISLEQLTDRDAYANAHESPVNDSCSSLYRVCTRLPRRRACGAANPQIDTKVPQICRRVNCGIDFWTRLSG